MKLTNEQYLEFEKLSKELIKFLCENCDPHTTVLVTTTDAEILSGVAAVRTEEFIRLIDEVEL